MPNFNGASNNSDRVHKKYDRDAIEAALRACAYRWVPEIFPQGKLSTEKGERIVRCADISGRPPRDQGSCIIHMEGEHAGEWVDFSTDGRGGPFSTLIEHFGLPKGHVYDFAIKLCEDMGQPIREAQPQPQLNGRANGRTKKQ